MNARRRAVAALSPQGVLGRVDWRHVHEPNAGTDVLGLATSAKKDVSAPLRCSFPPAPAEAGGVMCASGRRVGAERVQDVDHKRRRQRL